MDQFRLDSDAKDAREVRLSPAQSSSILIVNALLQDECVSVCMISGKHKINIHIFIFYFFIIFFYS